MIATKINIAECSISFPECSFPLTSGLKTRALGATISGMRHRCRRSETADGQNSVTSFVISKLLLPELSFLRETKTLETKLLNARTYHISKLVQTLHLFQMLKDALYIPASNPPPPPPSPIIKA